MSRRRVDQVEVPGLEEQRIALFQAVFDRYLATEQWPLLQKVARDLVEQFDVEDVVRGLGWPWVENGNLNGNNQVILRLPAIARCKGSEEMLAAFLAALQLASKKYFDKNLEPHLTQQGLVSEAGLSNPMAHHALLLLKSENLFDGIQGTVPGDMVMKFGGKVRKYRNVKTLDEYLALSGDRAAQDHPLGRIESPFAIEPPASNKREYTPNTAFVMMWLARDNPDKDATAAAIRESFAAYGVQAVHAMDVDHDGVITDLILSRIRDAEYLVADLTGARPSVYYEVGYAHALGKHPMLVRKRDTPIHFDLALHNAPEYEDIADLKALLARRLAERIGPAPARTLP